MAVLGKDIEVLPARGGTFATTNWGMVLAAGEEDSPRSEAALTQLYQTYWYSLYSFVRRQGCTSEDAQDFTQSFFLHLLERRDFARLRRENGRFRAFLLVALKHFLVNEWERARAQKRGGRRVFITLDDANADERFAAEATSSGASEKHFDRSWAMSLLQKVFGQLRREYYSNGRETLFEALKVFLSPESIPTQSEIAKKLGLSENAVKQAVYRLRERYRQLLRDEIAHTVANPGDIEDELRYLVDVLRG